jgi:hypothetical protein
VVGPLKVGSVIKGCAVVAEGGGARVIGAAGPVWLGSCWLVVAHCSYFEGCAGGGGRRESGCSGAILTTLGVLLLDMTTTPQAASRVQRHRTDEITKSCVLTPL